jgi:DNA-binding CsgD family transcriptional regulator
VQYVTHTEIQRILGQQQSNKEIAAQADKNIKEAEQDLTAIATLCELLLNV